MDKYYGVVDPGQDKWTVEIWKVPEGKDPEQVVTGWTVKPDPDVTPHGIHQSPETKA